MKYLLLVLLIFNYQLSFSQSEESLKQLGPELIQEFKNTLDNSASHNALSFKFGLNYLVATLNTKGKLNEDDYNHVFSIAEKDPVLNKELTSIKSKLDRELIPYRKRNLIDLFNEINLYSKQGQNPNFHIVKYENYKEKFKLTSVDMDKEIEKIKKESKLAVAERKANCTNVMNLDESSSLKLEKPKNQDSIGWCYAYTAADLLTHALGKEASAAYAALLFNSTRGNLNEGGLVDVALEELRSNGMCLEKDLPSSDYQFSLSSNYDLKKVFYDIRDFTNELKDKKITTNKDAEKILCSNMPLALSLKEIFPKMNIKQIVKVLLESSDKDAFKKMADESCSLERGEDLKNLKITNCNIMAKCKKEDLWKTIDDQLNKGNILGLTIKAADLLPENKTQALAANGTGMFHALSAVGRRFNPKTQSCEYLLRNSWGKGCSIYNSDYECKDGNIWISEQIFKQKETIWEAVYVEKGK